VAEGQAVLGSTSAKIRRLGRGGRLVFGRRSIQVAGVLPDTAVGAHEVFVSLRTAAHLGITLERYLLIDPSSAIGRKRLTARITRLLPPGVPIRIRGPGETPYFRQGDAVLPTVKMKELFGEFAGRPRPDGTIEADPAWSSRNITIESVPIIGNVQCNRAIFPQLRGALHEIEADGLSSLIDRSQYGGCWVPRFVNRNPKQEISHHSWGVAIDLNVADNPFGRTPHMNPRVVAAFEHWGFTWGGRWLRPDGMHFEFISSPAAAA
jgi:hypothetical protein